MKKNQSSTLLSLTNRSLLYPPNVRLSVDLLPNFHNPAHLISCHSHKARYQSIASASLLPPDSLIAPPPTSQYYTPPSQGFGTTLDDYPKEPPSTAMTYNTSVQLRTQSFTSSAYELAMSHCFPSVMNPAFNRFTTSVGAPHSAPQIPPSTSHFKLSHPSSSSTSTPSAPIPQPPLISPPLVLVDNVDHAKSADTSGAPLSPKPGPARNASSGVIACRQWCVISLGHFDSIY